MTHSSETRSAASVLLMSAEDNCLIASATLEPGAVVTIDGQQVTLRERIDIGHKLARRTLAVGEKVFRYGAPIGSVTRPIALGAHIHTHNLGSDYLPTYTLGTEGHQFLESKKP